MAITLVKYVLVTRSGDWLDMGDRYAPMKALADRHPGTRVERWSYPVLPDGTHGAPGKVSLSR